MQKVKDTVFKELSDREYQILGLTARCYTSQDIASELGISVNTVGGAMGRIYSKLNLTADAPTSQRLKASLIYWGVARITETGSVAFLQAPAPRQY